MSRQIKNLCIIQARMGASRLPGKVLKKVGDLTLLEYEIKRVKQAKLIDQIVVATTDQKRDDKIAALCRRIKVSCFRGSEADVLDRYWQCARRYPAYHNIIRITGDCPLVDPAVIDRVIEFYLGGRFDYASNIKEGRETYPDGLDVEIFSRQALEAAASQAKLASEREHVTPYIEHNKRFKKGGLSAAQDWSHFRLTVDEPADLEVIRFLIKNSELTDGFLHYISVLTKNPQVMLKNMKIKRNEGYLKSLRNDYIIK